MFQDPRKNSDHLQKLTLLTLVHNLLGKGTDIGLDDLLSGGSSYGRTGRPPPPHWLKLRAGHGGATQTRGRGKFSLKSLTFGHFLYKNVQKAFSFRGEAGLRHHDPPPGALPLDPAGGSAPAPRLGSRSARSPWSAPSPLGKSWIRHWTCIIIQS